MNFPFVPLPSFILEMFPHVCGMHVVSALLGAVPFMLVGIYTVLIWSQDIDHEGEDNSKYVKGQILGGYFYIVLGILFLVFGLYFMTIFMIVCAAYAIHLFIKSFKVLKG